MRNREGEEQTERWGHTGNRQEEVHRWQRGTEGWVPSSPPEVTSDSSLATKIDMKINVLSKGQKTSQDFREALEAYSSKLP